MDFRAIAAIFCLMAVSLIVISSYTAHSLPEGGEEGFFTPTVLIQMKWFFLGGLSFLFFAGFDYNKIREWTWFLYALMLVSLIGLYFVDSIQRVNRWYKIPFLHVNFQPSELAKLVVVIALSWYLERKKGQASSLRTALMSGLIVGVPFVLILKQPDLGSALVLFPITLVLFYFGDIHEGVVRFMALLGLAGLVLVSAIFLEILPYEAIKPYATLVLKEYQFERFNPNTPHQVAAATSIAIGGLTGTGFRKSTYASEGWLPFPYTDSVFPAFGEEFGLIGLVILIALFYSLLYFSFQTVAVAKDPFGRLLAAGITVYLAMHILVNIGMMCGILPITGVPLVLVTYGGSSIIATMSALGILQSIYSRRFVF